MNGQRLVGHRKQNLLLNIQRRIYRLSKRGLNPIWYLNHFQKVRASELKHVPTKKLTGIISSLQELETMASR